MHGDLSWAFRHRIDNLIAPLDQQGRVHTDRDGNDRTALAVRWQDEAARSTFGAGVAAVPASQAKSFLVESAQLVGGQVVLDVNPGLVWADGLLAYLTGQLPQKRIATPLQPPLQPLPADLGAPGTRDAVVLELWREALSGFQRPDELIEPALGGPDTAERLQTAMAFRLFRMGDDDTCDTITDRLKDDFANRGKLTVQLQPTTVVSADCPELAGGGYTGFEHNLYRIEVADVDPTAPGPMFKWSQFNGGLVGRGTYDSGTNKITITANDQAILRSDLTQFYLEILHPDDDALGYWRVSYGAPVTLGSDGELAISGPKLLGTAPPSGTFFFRLWNDVRPIADFPATLSNELRDGIQLQFDAPGAGASYVPGDYWTFTVRAGGIVNPPTLVAHQPPEGIRHHRVVLGVLNWIDAGQVDPIDDCRTVFNPLTEATGCCTYRVGKHGDFTSIQAAILALPKEGGRVCVLPGDYHENVTIFGRRNVIVSGCGLQTRVWGVPPKEGEPQQAVFTVLGSQQIRLQSMTIVASPNGIGVLLQDASAQIDVLARTFVRSRSARPLPLDQVTLDDLDVIGGAASGIEARGGTHLTVRDSRVRMREVRTVWPGITILGEDVLLERNLVTLFVERFLSPPPEEVTRLFAIIARGHALGGIWLRGNCKRVRVVDNAVEGGMGNGIILGDISVWQGEGELPEPPGWVYGGDDPCATCLPGSDEVPPSRPGTNDPVYYAGPPLEDIWIERNRILGMGLNGIGVYGFFANDQHGIISVHRLTILGNQIRECLQRPIGRTPANMLQRMGYGGIALADVEELVAHDNVITDNGPDHLQPVCGIYVFHGAGVDLSRNRILNNGIATSEPPTQAAPGARAGVYVQLATMPNLDENQKIPSASGIPALRLHESIVTQPLGPALWLTALGQVSVQGNALTSHGIALTGPGAAVQILNLGIAEELGGAKLSYSVLGTANAAPAFTTSASASAIRLPQFTLNGQILFTGNQVRLEALTTARSPLHCSVLILTLDDLGFSDNQSCCRVPRSSLLTDVLLFGITARLTNNRLQESLVSTSLSAAVVGWSVTATSNQSTHCLIVRGVSETQNAHNIVLTATAADCGAKYAAVMPDLKG